MAPQKQIPLISIITVVYNRVNCLENSISSVLNQPDLNTFEYIIIDGGSTDGTVDIIKKHEKCITKWISEPDTGIYNAMNKGVKLAKGEYIMFLNSDDWLEVNVMEKATNIILSNPKYDVYHGYLLIHDKEKRKNRGHGFLPTSLPAYQPASFVRRDINNDIPWFDENYRIAADFKFFKSLQLRKQRFFPMDIVVTNFSIGGLSSQSESRLKELKQVLIELKYPPLLVEVLIFRIYLTTLVSNKENIFH
jgi:glycosyltransferase involved in cell wall biosynthesis